MHYRRGNNGKTCVQTSELARRVTPREHEHVSGIEILESKTSQLKTLNVV